VPIYISINELHCQ